MPISKLDNLASVISNRTAIVLGYEFNENNELWQVWISHPNMGDDFILKSAYKTKNICDESLEFYAGICLIKNVEASKVILPRKIIYPDCAVSILVKFKNFAIESLRERDDSLVRFPPKTENKIVKYLQSRRSMNLGRQKYIRNN
ncbi:MAG: hypothetical protein PUP92_26355 [Rhizonema sp. PD38]|nr:hypothetical protein [Rhizonema sp. PD38]